MNAFAQLPAKAQVYRLRQAALQALQAYPFAIRRLTLLYHGFNTTFRVDTTENQRYALRINVNSRRTTANIQAEIQWLDALSKETGLSVARPVPTVSGAFLQKVQVPDLPEARPTVLFHWIPGPLLGDRRSPELFQQLGAVTAQLHQHARDWSLPEGCALPTTTSIYLGDQVVLFDAPGREILSDQQLALFSKGAEQAQRVLDGIYRREGVPIPLHTDLHSHNLKVWRSTLQVFDFDDCALGHPIQDIANVYYYLTGFPERAEYWERFQQGYRQVLPWTFDGAEIEALKAGRALLLANDFLKNLNPDVRKGLPTFMERTTLRMAHWLEQGSYQNPDPT